MSTPNQGAPGAPPPSATAQSGESLRDRTILLIYLGLLAFASGTFLLLALTGTTADPLGGPNISGTYDWELLAKGLPPIRERSLPTIFRPGQENDPMTFDSRPEGPPKDPALLPPETKPEPIEDMSEEDRAAAQEAAEVAAEQRRIRKEAQAQMERADDLLRSNRYPQAKEIYVQAAKLDPSFKRAIASRFFKKAKDQEEKRSWSRAKLLYRMALHFDYENSKLHQALASTSKALGDKRKAVEHERLAEKFASQGK